MYGALTTDEEKVGAAAAQDAPAPGEVLLAVEGLSKKFCRSLKRSLFYGVQDIAVELVGGRRASERLRPGEFWALSDVSCTLRRGEALGLVGPNGAGKSTLLRLISGLIKLDAGRITVRGRVAPLIALGAGFNPVLTGLENVYANMSILGLSTREITRRLDEVLAFAEIDPDALEAPVRTYSSGMAARLGFACAVHTDPDILLIDEVLAVGDVKFRMKCYRRLADLRERGTAFVLVSHNPQSLMAVCSSAIYLSQGRLLAAGSVDAVLSRYERDLFRGAAGQSDGRMSLPEKDESESTGLDIRAIYFRDGRGEVVAEPVSGEPVTLCIECRARRGMEGVGAYIIVRASGEVENMLTLDSRKDGGPLEVQPGESEIRLRLPYCGLSPGVYTAKINLNRKSIDILDGVESFRFAVAERDGGAGQGSFYQPRSWDVVSPSGEVQAVGYGRRESA